jgi:hypothetical protein
MPPTIKRRIPRTNIHQQYTLFPTPQAALTDAKSHNVVIIALFECGAAEERDVGAMGYDWIPCGQPLPELSHIVPTPLRK